MPVLAMGGEASFAPESLLRAAMEPLAADLTTAIIPKAGHWIVSLFSSSSIALHPDNSLLGRREPNIHRT